MANVKSTSNTVQTQCCINCQAPLLSHQKACFNCGLIIQDAAINPEIGLSLLLAGQFIGEFQILESLNSAPNSINYYRAKIAQGQLVFLKETKSGEPLAENLAETHRILQLVKHPALPESLSFFELDKRIYHAVEWKIGQSLPKVWREFKPFDPSTLEWVKQLSSLVNQLNMMDTVCLELDPANIGVDNAGNLYIQDFTLLRRIPFAEAASIGYSLYVAPEVYTNPKDVSPRTDVYAIGAAWLALLLGQPLGQSHIQDRHLLPPARLLKQIRVPPDINRLLARAVSPILNKRYKSPLLLKSAIEQAQAEYLKNQQLRQRFEELSFLAAWTDQGMVRDNNEDSFFAESYKGPQGSFTIAMIADGMGGEEGGEVASQLVCEVVKTVLPKKINEFCQKLAANHETTDLANNTAFFNTLLIEVLNMASQRVFSHAQQNQRYKSMGSTAVIMVTLFNQLFVVNVGDSRAYLARPSLDKGLIQLNEDHTRLADLRRKSKLVSDTEESHLQGILSRNIGSRVTVEPYFFSLSLQGGDLVMLCCDGVTDVLSDEQLFDLITSKNQTDLLDTCFTLLTEANLAGGQDNVTVVLYQHP